jgi:nicotinate-nucleotide adenylyltransferase
MRLGIYGGTFDPVHYGHLLLAEQCREQCDLDEVRFVPAAIPPHKEGANITAGKHRLNMLDLALSGCPELTISDIELRRTGPSYTVDTLQHLTDEDDGRELFLLMGMDSLVDFPDWRQPARILELATLVAVNRHSLHDEDSHEAAITAIEQLAPDARRRLKLVEIPDIEISSTDLRRRLCEGRSIRFQTPRPVAMYIAEHGLYQESY